MQVLLFSNGKIPGNTSLLEFGHQWLKDAIERTGAKKFLFIPYAMIRGNYDERLERLSEVLAPMGASITSIHNAQDKVQAIKDADAFIVSGGNTWVLNKTLHDLGLISFIRRAVVDDGKLYVGWSAGTNIACPTIRTTNDMPIVSAAILPALNLVPFQINPHYLDANIEGHMGETRDERICEFLIQNPHEIVVGIKEGTMLQVDGDTLSYHSATGESLKLFRHNCEPQFFKAGDDISSFMRQGLD